MSTNDQTRDKETFKLERHKAKLAFDSQASQAALEREKLELERYKAQLDYENQASQANLEKEKLELERYRVRHDYKKFILGSVFVAIAVAAIPPLFQLATAGLEYVKSNADRQTKQQSFHDEYIKDFLSNALNQDIELRIRFAQYFAHVSTESSRQEWIGYLNNLMATREDIRAKIDKMEAQWQMLSSAKDRNETEALQLERNLAWAYNEVGYVQRNRSATANPRVSEAPPAGPIPPWLITMREINGTQWSEGPAPANILDWERLIVSKYPEMANYVSVVEQSYIDWSGLAIAYCMAMAGIKPPYDPRSPDRSFLQAVAWLDFGTAVPEPQAGDVLVFDFGNGDYHVTLFEVLAPNGRYLAARGGNQSHEVKLMTFLRSSLKSIRRPLS